MARRYSRRRSSPRVVRNPVQSYKKVLNFAPASRAAAASVTVTMATGTDSVAAGQTGPTDSAVPTGSMITSIDIQASFANLVGIASFLFLTVQHLRSGQGNIDPQAIGGDPQRNQVHLQLQRSLGMNQNRDFHIRFKIPKKYQRVREGDLWRLVTKGDTIRTDAYQIIYKFYR